MPLFYFSCKNCFAREEHFIMNGKDSKIQCPTCGSSEYEKQLSKFKLNVEYADSKEWMENKVQPLVDETYERIGKEAASEDTKTLDNLFGESKVDATFAHDDD